MSLTTRQTPRGQVVVGDLPADFLTIPSAAPSAGGGPSQQQQISADEATARALQQQQMYRYPAGFGQQLPSNVRGKLSITLAQAKLAKNYGLTKMDPYCRIRIGHAVFETPTASSGGKNPRWNKTVQCFLPMGVDHAYLEIFDEKTFQGDERIAWAHINIPESAFNGEVVDEWYNMTGKQGEDKEGMINIVISFTPMDTTQIQAQPQVMPQVVMMPGAPGMYPTFSTGGYTVPQPMMMQPAVVTPMGGMAVQRPMTAGGGAQVQQQAPPKMSEDDLNQCKDMFPSIDMEVIKTVAEAHRGDKDATINALLAMNTD